MGCPCLAVVRESESSVFPEAYWVLMRCLFSNKKTLGWSSQKIMWGVGKYSRLQLDLGTDEAGTLLDWDCMFLRNEFMKNSRRILGPPIYFSYY